MLCLIFRLQIFVAFELHKYVLTTQKTFDMAIVVGKA